MNLGFPSEKEQELVRKYVIERPLIRPSITYFKAFLLFFLVMVCSIIFFFALLFLLEKNKIKVNKKIFFLFFYGVMFFIFARWFAVLCIRLYQHYAPEEVRRRCLLKPTCSDKKIWIFNWWYQNVAASKL